MHTKKSFQLFVFLILFSFLLPMKADEDQFIEWIDFRAKPETEDAVSFWVRESSDYLQLGTFHVSFPLILDGRSFLLAALEKKERDFIVLRAPLQVISTGQCASVEFILEAEVATNVTCKFEYSDGTPVPFYVVVNLAEYSSSRPYRKLLDTLNSSKTGEDTRISSFKMDDCIKNNNWAGAMNWVKEMQTNAVAKSETNVQAAIRTFSSRIQKNIDMSKKSPITSGKSAR
jgi:hypothetical protein